MVTQLVWLGYWHLVVINYDIFLLRLFDFHVAETCSTMLTRFFFNVHVWLVHLVGYNGCCVRLNILPSALVLIEPIHLRDLSSIT